MGQVERQGPGGEGPERILSSVCSMWTYENAPVGHDVAVTHKEHRSVDTLLHSDIVSCCRDGGATQREAGVEDLARSRLPPAGPHREQVETRWPISGLRRDAIEPNPRMVI